MKKLNDIKIGVSRVLILCLIVAVFTAGIVVATSPTQPFTINRGIYPGAVSFTIWEEDGTYFAKNPYGVIAYSGTDAATIINTVIASVSLEADISNSQTIKFIGTFVVSDTILLVSNYTIYDGGYFVMATGANCDMFYAGANTSGLADYTPGQIGITMQNMVINGNKAENTAGNGIVWECIHKSTMRNMYIYDLPYDGLLLTGSAGQYCVHGGTDNLYDYDVRIYACNRNGIEALYQGMSNFNCWVAANSWNGLSMYECDENYVRGSYRDTVSVDGKDILLNSCNLNQIIGVIANSGGYGLYLTASTENSIVGGHYSEHDHCGLYINGHGNMIVNVFGSSDVAEGGLVETGGTNNTVLGCQFLDNFYMDGTNYHAVACWNGTNWIN